MIIRAPPVLESLSLVVFRKVGYAAKRPLLRAGPCTQNCTVSSDVRRQRSEPQSAPGSAGRARYRGAHRQYLSLIHI
eukprot:4964903-Prymnesium_polylepis.1